MKKNSGTAIELTKEKSALNFILSAIACNCLVSLDTLGFTKDLELNGLILKSKLETSSKDWPLIKSIFTTLIKCGILEDDISKYDLTKFGREIFRYKGLINMLFSGYSDLIKCQSDISKNSLSHNTGSLLKGEVIANASILFGKDTVDPIILNEFSSLNFLGTICDLGCGAGTRLLELCEKTSHSGLGFDNDLEVVDLAKNNNRNSNIIFQHQDITNLEGIWEDVVITMQYFVFHDFNSKKCIDILNSYLSNFPNLRYFYYLDIVSPSPEKNDIMPGFDYVHGLQGICPRTYEETIDMFCRSRFSLVKELSIPGLPNTFLWVLAPEKNF